MHGVLEFIKDETKDMERKIMAGNKPTTGELQYLELLMKIKKNVMECDAMEGGSYSTGSYRSGSYANSEGSAYREMAAAIADAMSGRRDSMGRYMSRGSNAFKDDFRELMEKAPDAATRHKLEQMFEDMDRR